MKIWVGVTDQHWFNRLNQLRPDEVNFWQPSGSREFRVLQPGELFLFKLHSPNNFIVGGGHFVRYSTLPASLAWDAFLEKNGVGSLEELRARIQRYRRSDEAVDPEIGCNILAEPFFFERSAWVPVPTSWARNIVQGKSYDTGTPEGRSLWSAVQEAASRSNVAAQMGVAGGVGSDERYGAEYLTRGRLGQGAFRVMVTDAYRRRCAVTGEKTLPVLEAAHIRPYALNGPNQVSNGLLLRSDLHKLFDLGYITVAPELKLLVSRRLREEWHNGREYYAHHGQPLLISSCRSDDPPGARVPHVAQREPVSRMSNRGAMEANVLAELRDALRRFAAERDWDQFHSPKNLAIALSVEAGELLERFQWLSEAESQSPSPTERSRVEQEMADVLLYLIRLADRLNVDLAAAAREKMKMNAEKYPVEKARGKSKKYTEL